MNTPTAALDAAQVWAWLGDVPDPEIPVISVVDLGIVRAVDVVSSEECIVTITPTYSGCPAMQVIADAVTDALRSHGVAKVTLVNQLAPAWTTDWMSEAGKSKLKGYGIAPPQQQVIDLIGQPTDQGAYVTGKAFIPFYFGSDKTRWEMVYKGQGRLIFSNQSGFGTGYYLTWVIHNANEGGYR